MAVFSRITHDGAPGITSEEISLEKEEPLLAELSSFIESVRNRNKPVVTGVDGREALRVALQIVEDAGKRL